MPDLSPPGRRVRGKDEHAVPPPRPPRGRGHPRRRRWAREAPPPQPRALLEGLNEPQREAVVHEGAPLLVVAGAGSGKTRVLTRRIAWLISERNAHPGSILAITFTNKAAAEMRERVGELVGGRAKIMWVSTFHSACVRILRKEIRQVRLQVELHDLRRRRLQAADDAGLPRPRPRRQAVPAARDPELGLNAKNELQDHEDAAKDARNTQEETYAEAYAEYQRRLRQANALDFDDLLMMTVHLFRAFPAVREKLAAPVPPRAGRRVPGHQPRAVRPDPRALRRADGRGDRCLRRGPHVAGRADGRGRRRPVDLRLPRRQHPQHPGLRAGLPERAHDHARAELPLDADDPDRRQRA